jgi:hypothetical protein
MRIGAKIETKLDNNLERKKKRKKKKHEKKKKKVSRHTRMKVELARLPKQVGDEFLEAAKRSNVVHTVVHVDGA